MTSTKLKRSLALALAGSSLAIGVPAALATGGGDGAASTDGGAPAAPSFVQDEQDRAAPGREDCPERDGGSGQDGSGESGAADGTTEAPAL